MPALAKLRFLINQTARKLFSMLPQKSRHNVYRSLVDCDPDPNKRLVLKIADTKEELEACFKLLHDAYVSSGFMTPDPSGRRVTIYHALPTTTTLCAKFDDQVVGNLSLIRESAIGFPLQRIFDLTGVREKEGQIAEVSALAVHPRFRRTGGTILFPLMKFMYEYCTTFFDTRHLLIAVNPNRIEMYESLLFFQRLTANVVENYDFANGAPAVGASLDLTEAPAVMAAEYARKRPRKNLHAYFTEVKLPNLQLPQRRYFTTNDPVLTPQLLDYFFKICTDGFVRLDARQVALIHSIYDLPAYKAILPPMPPQGTVSVRQHQRFSVKCPGKLTLGGMATAHAIEVQIVEVSEYGFQAYAKQEIPLNNWFPAEVRVGREEVSTVQALAVRDHANGFNGFYG